jgi:hypothetical protein
MHETTRPGQPAETRVPAAEAKVITLPTQRSLKQLELIEAKKPREPELPQRYHVRLENGQVLGPVAMPQLIEWVVTGKVNGRTLVREHGRHPSPLARMEPLSRLARQPVYDFGQSIDKEFGWNIDRKNLARVLANLAVRKETGLFVARNERLEKRIALEEGVPRFAASNSREELLGPYLIRQGLLREPGLRKALDRACKRGIRLGEALLDCGLLAPAVLLRSLNEQLEERVVELFNWRAGTFYFLRGPANVPNALPEPRSVLAMVARGVRQSYTKNELSEILTPWVARAFERAESFDADRVGFEP